MGLYKPVTNPDGVVTSYWHITHVNTYKDGSGTVFIVPFIDQAARNSGKVWYKPPIPVSFPNVEIASFPFDDTTLKANNVSPIAKGYEVLKLMTQFTDAEDC